ncbi:hypothetical protein JA1_001317 [Spathaspora sp. JA1]|nr:hypothetical protein JA1_001317 [Spathaspora sp. JA1]
MYGSPFTNNNRSKTSTPSHFRDSARNAIYQQLPPTVVTSPPSADRGGAPSIRSAPPLNNKYQMSHRSSASSIFSSISGKRSVRSAPSIYSSSTATIPEDSEPISTTVEQLVNDISLHETHFHQQQQLQEQEQANKKVSFEDIDTEEMYKISLGSDLQYQNVSESLIDWNLNVTRCKLIITTLPSVSTIPDFQYNQNSLPQLIGDLANSCHIVLIQPHITDKELIYTLYTSNVYQEHNLDASFKKSVAEISVKQSRLLQINSGEAKTGGISQYQHSFLKFKFKEIAIRNYLINLAAAATTAHEYKLRSDQLKMELRTNEGKKVKLSKEDKKQLWEKVRSDVFQRAGLE